MTRDEIRKKWQNGEFVGKQSEDNIAEGTQLRPVNQRAQEEPKNIWQQVEQKTNELMNNTANTFSKESKNKNVWQDIKGIGKIVGQSVKKTGLSSLSYMENATANNFETYKKRQKEMGEAKYAKENDGKVITVSDKGERKMLGASDNPTRDTFYKAMDEAEGKIQEEVGKQSNKVTKKIAELTPSMTQSVVGMAASAVNPAIGLSFWQTSAGGDYVRQAEQKGMTGKQALAYGTIMGSMESATEWVGGELTKNVGKGAKATLKALGKEEVKSQALKALASYGLDIGENFLEEAIMEPIEEVVTEAMGGEADWSNMKGRMLESGFNGALTSIIMGGASMGIGSAMGVMQKAENGQQISQEEIKKALIDINKSEEIDIEKALVRNFNFNPQDFVDIKEVNKTRDAKMEKVAGEISNSEGKLLLQQKKDTDEAKKSQTEEKQTTTIENKPVLENKQQITQEETKEAGNENTEQTEEKAEENQKEGTKEEEKELPKEKSLLIKPKLDNELNKERAKNILGRIERNVQNREAKIESKIEQEKSKIKEQEQADQKARYKLLDNIDSYVSDNNINREQIKHIKNNAIEQGIDAEKFKSLSKEEIESLMNNDIPKYKEENKVQETKPKEKPVKLPEVRKQEEVKTEENTDVTVDDLNLLDQERDKKRNAKENQKSDAEMVEYLNDVDRRTDNAKKNIKAQEQEEKANAIENKELNVSEDEERQRRYEKEDIKEHNKKQKEEGKEYAGNDNSFKEIQSYEQLDRINKKTLKKENVKKSLDKLLDNEDFRKEITKRANISDKNYTLTKEDIYEDAGHLNSAINYMFERNNANREAKMLEQKEAQELLNKDAERYEEFENEYNKKVQQAKENVDKENNSTNNRELNQALLDTVENNPNVETVEREEATNENEIAAPETQAVENNVVKKEVKQEKPKQQERKETWQETRDRETREFYDMSEEEWDDLSEESKWGYRNRFKNNVNQEIDSNIRNKVVDKVEQTLNESKTVDEDIIGILDGKVTREDNESKLTARDLWEEYKSNEKKLNNKNDDLTFVTFNGNRVSTNEENFNSYLDLTTPEQFIDDLRNAVAEKNKANFNETYGITESVYKKALNVKDANQLAENNEIISALASNDDTYKARVLDDLGNRDIVSKEDFRKNFNSRPKAPGSKNIEYSRYLDEKLRRLVYDRVNEKYDIADEFTQEEVRRIRDLETKVKVHKTIADRYKEIIKSFMSGKTNKVGKDIKLTDIKEKNVIQNPNSKSAKFRKFVKAISNYVNTAERVNENTFTPEAAKAIHNEFFQPLNDSLADMVRFMNDVVKVVDDFGIDDGSEDSKLLFQLVDGYEYDDTGKPIGGFNESILRQRLGKGQEARIQNLLESKKIVDNVLSNILDRANTVLKDNGFPEIPRRKNYITHRFAQTMDAITEYLPRIVGNETQEDKAKAVLELFQTANSSVANSENNNINNEGLEKARPTSPNEKARKGKMTETDAIKSVKTYAQNMSRIIYLTEHVQKLRAFEKLLRQTAQLESTSYEDAVYDFENLTEEEQLQREAIRLTGGFEEYTNWLHSYINDLVGMSKDIKTNNETVNTILNTASDFVNKISGRLGANAVSWNAVTPFTNLIPAIKTMAMTNPAQNMKSIGQIVGETLGLYDDGVLENSNLWTRRQGVDLNLKNKSLGQTIRDVGMKPMNAFDDFATEFIVRAKYNEALSNLKKNAKKTNSLADADNLRNTAMRYADDYAARMLAERTTGRTPLAFGSGILKPLTQFQIEPTNEAIGYIHDMAERYRTDQELFGFSSARSAANIAVSGANMIFLSQVFNNAFEAAFGNRPAIDLMEVVKIALGYDVEPDDDDEDKNQLVSALKYLAGFSEEKNDKTAYERLSAAGSELWSYAPIVNQISSNARIPTFGALSDITEGAKEFVENIGSEETQNKALVGAKTVGKNLGKYFLLPAGGIQANRVLETVATFKRGANYNDNGEMRYPVQDQDKTAIRQTQALLFGRKNLPTAKEYSARYKESGKGKFSAKNTELYESLDNVSYKDFTRVIDSPKTGKMNALNNIDASQDDKWKIFNSNILSKEQSEKATTIVDNNLVTKGDYMDKYEEYDNQNVNMPSEKDIEKMKENDISFDLYSKYKFDVNNMQAEQEKVKNTTLLLTGKDISKDEDDKDDYNVDEEAKITILQDNKYTDNEREKLYTSFVLGNGENADKSRKNYEDFKNLGSGDSTEINTYFEWRQSGLASKGKKQEVLNWLNSHDLTQDQKTFLMSKKGYKLTNSQKRLLESKGVELSKKYKK